MILNIETSSKKCSVAVSDSGAVAYYLQADRDMDHATRLAPFVDRCLRELRAREKKLDAVAVSMGPGSYTGLRIGLSLAKGLCFGLGLPLIGINTLTLLAVKAMFATSLMDEDTVYVPMIDARRMEVYTAAYDSALRQIISPTPLILDDSSYSELAGRKVVMIGDGVKKAKDVVKIKVDEWIDAMPDAADMTALAEKALREKDFLDIAYSTPFYLKNFQATTPKSRL